MRKMSVTLRQLCANNNYRYGLHMVAGERGLDNIVQWVHTLEDEEVGDFLHGGELIFTTGIGHRNMQSLEWLLPLARKLNENEASGIVINVGPYISEVPEEVIQYGNETGFPIFTMPWEVHVVDVTRDFCGQLIEREKKEDNIGNILQHIIFYPSDFEKYMPELEKSGFCPTKSCCLLGIQIVSNENTTMQSSSFIKQYIKRKINNLCNQVGFFVLQDIMYFALGDCSDDELSQIVKELHSMSQERLGQSEIYVGVGSNQEGLDKLAQNYRRVSMMLPLTETKKKKVLVYDELGVKKILLSVSDMEVLRKYEKEILGKLEEYDEGNHTNLLEIFRMYLDCGGSVQQVAEKNFTHRNTINYQIKKIKNIIGCDISSLDCRLELLLAYQIRDILN